MEILLSPRIPMLNGLVVVFLVVFLIVFVVVLSIPLILPMQKFAKVTVSPAAAIIISSSDCGRLLAVEGLETTSAAFAESWFVDGWK